MSVRMCSMCHNKLPETEEFFAMRYDRKVPQFQSQCKECQAKYRRRHYLENKDKYIRKAAVFTRSIMDWFKDIKRQLKCEICGENRHWVLDFHHIDSATKESDIADIIRKGSKKKIEEEMKKCSVLCANCHRDLHYRERQAAQVLMNTQESSKLQ